MSPLDAAFFVILYSFHHICIGGLSFKDDLKKLGRHNFEGDLQSQQNLYPNAWQAANHSILAYQENNSNIIKEGWTEVKYSPKETFSLGQASGVSIDSKGFVYVFHRGDREWNSETFDSLNRLRDPERHRGPISLPTVIVYHPTTGDIIQKWGENMFYMPHGITVDQDNNVWMTDVALHQVFKFSPLKTNPETAQLTLGEPFVPGNDAAHFCKPTDIAITPWGDFFVADGYCNSRIVKFNKNGVKISEWGRSTSNHGIGQPANYMFSVPHALTLAEDKGLVCVADRENGRIECFDWHNGTFVSKLSSSFVGSRLFSVTYSPLTGGLFFVVNGPEMKQFPVLIGGSVITAQNKEIFQFGVNKFQNPHDIAVSCDGKNIFVVEIGPFKLWKYESNQAFDAFVVANNISVTAPAPAPVREESVSNANPGLTPTPVSPSGFLPAVLVTSAALLFAAALLTAALIYSRAKRRGRSLLEENYYRETKKLVLSEY